MSSLSSKSEKYMGVGDVLKNRITKNGCLHGEGRARLLWRPLVENKGNDGKHGIGNPGGQSGGHPGIR